MAKKIRDLASLDKEIARLRKHAKTLEGELDDNFSYLQQHSSSLMLNTLLAGFINKESLPGNIVNLFIQNEKLQKTVGSFAEVIVDKIVTALDFLIGKISPKKD